MEKFVQMIIRPERSYYIDNTNQSELSLAKLNVTYTVKHFELFNSKNVKLKCSLASSNTLQHDSLRPCVVYLHGNTQDKNSGLNYASDLMPLEIDLFTFDFTGCGLSDGEYITLGWKERDDLKTVLAYLESQNQFSSLIIWGGGMGAATALMH